MRNGNVYIITGPSGVGKTAVINALLERFADSARLVTTTTREPRPGETDGKDYFFVSRKEFEVMAENGEFLEYFENYGNLYGTSRKRLDEYLAKYSTVFIGGIDTRGARAVKEKLSEAVTIFLLPDTMENLRKRLQMRKGKDDIETRLAQAAEKIRQAGDFDHRVVNPEGRITEAVDAIADIVNFKAAHEVVGLDMDGVIIDHTQLKIQAARLLGIELRPEDTPSEFLKSKLPLDVYRRLKYMIYDDAAIASTAQLMDGALLGLEALKTSGTDYYLISRRLNPGMAREHLKLLGVWGTYFGDANAHFVNSDSEKNEVASKLHVGVYLDDQTRVLKLLDVKRKFLFDPLNTYADADWYQRVSSWPQFLSFLSL